MTADLYLPAGDPSAGQPVALVTPESAGWGYSGLEVRELRAGQTWTVELTRDEGLVLPLRGGAHVSVTGPESAEIDLAGRPGVFAGPPDFVYLPLGSTVTITSDDARILLSTTRATRVLPLRHVPKDQVRVDLRGAGNCSRQVNNFTMTADDVEAEHMLACEVITPGGNWSSYPPHKHDEHTDTERELEEIYYFEVSDGPAGQPGVGYYRNYGTDERPMDVQAEVRSGDVTLVPHGFHGPVMAPPGYDVYYFNVMAGPATDHRWLAVDDPAVTWVRRTWEDQEFDPRLPCPIPAPSVDADAPTH